MVTDAGISYLRDSEGLAVEDLRKWKNHGGSLGLRCSYHVNCLFKIVSQEKLCKKVSENACNPSWISRSSFREISRLYCEPLPTSFLAR
jgi:hypothetical protein